MRTVGVRIVALARGWIGTPYLHQASVKGAGTDCLGLLRGVWREVYGCEPEDVPAYTPDWSEASGEERLWLAAKRHLDAKTGPLALGDILLFRMHPHAVAKHLGIASALGNRRGFIHAYSRHGVVESPLSDVWARKIVARFQFPENFQGRRV